MWPFLHRKKKTNQDSECYPFSLDHHPRWMKFAELAEEMGDFSDFKVHGTALKFWFPEPAAEALEELCERNGDSISEALRQFFAQHCYGLYAFQVMNEAVPGLFRDPPPPLFSRAQVKAPPGKKRIDTYWVPELGKDEMSGFTSSAQPTPIRTVSGIPHSLPFPDLPLR